MAGKRRDSWMIETHDFETEEAFRAAVAEELARFEHIGYRQGFGLVAAPVRQRIGDGVVTLAWQFRAERIPLVPGDPRQAGPTPEVSLPELEDEPSEDDVEAGPEPEEIDEPEEHADDLDRQPASVATTDPYAKPETE